VTIWTIIAKVIGLLPSAAEAGKAIAASFRDSEPNPMNSLLWHSVTYGRGLMYCQICGMYVDKQNVLCSEAVRRQKARR
jgi:hypothetical protein